MALNNNDFIRLKKYIYDNIGISIDDSKKEMMSTKIYKIANKKNMTDMSEYVSFITTTTNEDEIREFYNAITTNTTEFFREKDHFDYITGNIKGILDDIPRIRQNREIRVWSSASSTGQEPVTIAIVLSECLEPGIKIKILGTDISEKVLKAAQRGCYTAQETIGVPKNLLGKYFDRVDGGYETGREIKSMLTYRYFNLMDSFNFKKGFDIIFCRNVMIYFDNNVQQQLLDKFYGQLAPGGLLFIGHSESLFNKKHNYKSIQPAVFKK